MTKPTLRQAGLIAFAIIETPSAIKGHRIYHGKCLTCGLVTERFLDDPGPVVALAKKHKACES